MTHDNSNKLPYLPAEVRVTLARQASTGTKLTLAQLDRAGREATEFAWDRDAYGLTFPHTQAQTPAQWRDACKLVGNVADLMRRGATPQALAAGQTPEIGLIAAQLAGWAGKKGGETGIFHSLVELGRYEEACRYLAQHPAVQPTPGGQAPEADGAPMPYAERPVDADARAHTALSCFTTLSSQARHRASLTPLVGALLATGAPFSPEFLDNDALHAAWTAAHRAGGALPPPALNQVAERLRVAICSRNPDALQHLLTHHAAALQSHDAPVFDLFSRENSGREGNCDATDGEAMALLLRARLVGQPCHLTSDVRLCLLETLEKLGDPEITAAFVAARGAAGETWMHADRGGAAEYARLGLSPFIIAAGRSTALGDADASTDRSLAILDAFKASGAIWPAGYAELVGGGDAVAFWRQRPRAEMQRAAPTLMPCAAWVGDVNFMSWLTAEVDVADDTTTHAVAIAIERDHWSVVEAFSASLPRASFWPMFPLWRALEHADKLSTRTIGHILEAIDSSDPTSAVKRAMAARDTVRALCLADLREPIVWRDEALVALLARAGAVKTILDVCPQWFATRGLEGLCATTFYAGIFAVDDEVASVVDACVARGMEVPTSLPVHLIADPPEHWARNDLWNGLKISGEARASLLFLSLAFDVPWRNGGQALRLAAHEVPMVEMWLARHGACWRRIDVATLQAIFASGVDPNVRCFSTGETFMHRAKPESELRAMLLEAGARRDIPDLRGRLPAQD